jgi:thiamine pyrophosphate-dependent acetolactate synthase large subunit-like protein
VHCDTDVAAIGRHVDVDAGLVGDVELVADKLIELFDMAELPPSGHRDPELDKQLRAYVAEFPNTSTPKTADLYSSIAKVADALGPDRITVTDAGRFVIEAFKVLKIKHSDLWYYNMKFGAIGLGMGSAIGASYARPEFPTLLITGDGGFMNGGLAEFNTAVRHNVDLVVLLCNDGGYGMEEVEFRERNMPHDITTANWPDFGPVAEALGGQGITVRDAADLDRALEAIRNRKRPLLIDLKLDMLALPGLH